MNIYQKKEKKKVSHLIPNKWWYSFKKEKRTLPVIQLKAEINYSFCLESGHIDETKQKKSEFSAVEVDRFSRKTCDLKKIFRL